MQVPEQSKRQKHMMILTGKSSKTLEQIRGTSEQENQYISQLDLYLMANFNLSKKDCEKKGFTKASKIENIKKHFYSSVNQRKS